MRRVLGRTAPLLLLRQLALVLILGFANRSPETSRPRRLGRVLEDMVRFGFHEEVVFQLESRQSSMTLTTSVVIGDHQSHDPQIGLPPRHLRDQTRPLSLFRPM